MIHLLDSLVWIYGHRLQNLVRPGERITPPWKGNLNAGLVTIQALSYGTFAEIYRDRLFTLILQAVTGLLNMAIELSDRFSTRFRKTTTMPHDLKRKRALGGSASVHHRLAKKLTKFTQYTSLNGDVSKH
jgi:hypothetical protein